MLVNRFLAVVFIVIIGLFAFYAIQISKKPVPPPDMRDASGNREAESPISITNVSPPVTKTEASHYPKPHPETSHPSPVEEQLYLKIMNIISPTDKYAGIRFTHPLYRRSFIANYQEMANLLANLMGTYPDSTYYQHYQETYSLINQMIQEDEKNIGYRSPALAVFLGKENKSVKELSLPEKIECYIYDLRGLNFCKINNRYEIDWDVSVTEMLSPNDYRPSSVFNLVDMGKPAVPALLNLLEDRRPIIVVDDTKIPAIFYRYQDAAVEILEHIAKRKMPVELPETEYFSEYMAKQTPEKKQQIITDIKAWAEESIRNLPDSQPPQPTNNGK